MKNGLVIFTGAFATLALSWAGVVLTAHQQYGALTQYKDPAEETLWPQPLNGLAAQGNAVYQDLGCVACHTQQVRREGFGGDVARKWGTRQSVARDYIGERAVLIGSSRIGPDLRNVGARAGTEKADAEAYFYKILYAPGAIAPGMPSYKFLFEVRPVNPAQPSAKAIKVPGTPAGYEVVPTARAEALVAYLANLKDTYEYPEARPFVEDTTSAEGHGAKKEEAHPPAKKEGGH
jgi:cytochrome c oxidase cbb3-type subunit 2